VRQRPGGLLQCPWDPGVAKRGALGRARSVAGVDPKYGDSMGFHGDFLGI